MADAKKLKALIERAMMWCGKDDSVARHLLSLALDMLDEGDDMCSGG